VQIAEDLLAQVVRALVGGGQIGGQGGVAADPVEGEAAGGERQDRALASWMALAFSGSASQAASACSSAAASAAGSKWIAAPSGAERATAVSSPVPRPTGR